MTRLTLIALLTLCSSNVFSQQDFFVFKRNNTTLNRFYKDAYIAFQLENKQWQTGYITKVQSDSFWIRPMVVFYGLMGTDTVHYNILPFAIADVYAMPKKGVQIDYVNGRFQIITWGGHVHWYWVKSGWIFRAGGAAYAGLNIVNGLVENNLSFRDSKKVFAIAAASYLFGALLHKLYKPVLPIGKKYHFEYINLSGSVGAKQPG